MFISKAEATKAAKELKAQLPGKGWGIRVWDSGSWYCECGKGPVSVCYVRYYNVDWGTKDSYQADIDCGYWNSSSWGGGVGIQIFGPIRRTPMGALRAAIKLQVTQMNRLVKEHKKAMQIITGGER